MDVNDMTIDQLFCANCSDKSVKNRQTILFEKISYKTSCATDVPSKLFVKKEPSSAKCLQSLLTRRFVAITPWARYMRATAALFMRRNRVAKSIMGMGTRMKGAQNCDEWL